MNLGFQAEGDSNVNSMSDLFGEFAHEPRLGAEVDSNRAGLHILAIDPCMNLSLRAEVDSNASL